MPLTDDPNDPRLARSVDKDATGQHDVYLVLSEQERAKGFVRKLRRTYVHEYWEDGRNVPITDFTARKGIVGCGVATKMGDALAETYARDPNFYKATFCVGCNKHLPVREFHWEDGSVLGS